MKGGNAMHETNQQKPGRGVVTMGMVDAKVATEPYFFMIDLDGDIFSQIRRERTFFLRMWLMHSEAMRTPEVNIFFEVGDDEWLFVEEAGKSRRQLKRLVLDNDAIKYSQFIKECVLIAYEKAVVAMQEDLFEKGEKTIKGKVLPFCRKK